MEFERQLSGDRSSLRLVAGAFRFLELWMVPASARSTMPGFGPRPPPHEFSLFTSTRWRHHGAPSRLRADESIQFVSGNVADEGPRDDRERRGLRIPGRATETNDERGIIVGRRR